jgi:hypothetical protein
VKKRNESYPYTFNHDSVPVFHNHFNGSARCVECAGPCKLTDPTQQALTCIVRTLWEQSTGLPLGRNDAVPSLVRRALEEHGIDLYKMHTVASRLKGPS